MTTALIPTTPNLDFKQGDKAWKALRKRALNDLYFFNSVILGFADVFPMEHETHLLPLSFVARATGISDLDEAPMQLVMWPRETGKTTNGTVGKAIWRAVKNPNIAILIANEKQQNAADFLSSIKNHFESNELLRSLFPEVIPPDFGKVTWSAERATVHRTTKRPEPTFDTIGTGGTVTGRHYDLIIGDDLISREAMENARSGNWTIMEKANRWINQLPPLLSNSAKPFPEINFIGTSWWNGDIYQYIENTFVFGEKPRRYRLKVKLPDGSYTYREAWRAGDLAVMKIAAIENGKPVFPKIWPLDRLQKVRETDPVFFACNLMNNPTDASVTTFKVDWLDYWRMIDGKTICYDTDDGKKVYTQVGDLTKIITVDPAFSSSGEGARSAILVLGTDMSTGKHLVLEADAQHTEPKETILNIINIAQRWGVTRIFVESVAQQLAFIQWLRQAAQDRDVPLSIDVVKPGGRNKHIRIESLSPYFSNHQLLVNTNQNDLITEYTDYRPGSKYVDLLDALAYAIEKAPSARQGGTAIGGNARQRSAEQRQSYLNKRFAGRRR